MTLVRKALAEFLGTATLLCTVIGSGIMAERLAGGNMAIALLANTGATVLVLYVLISLLGPASGAHFNPLVTLVLASKPTKGAEKRALKAIIFIASQSSGAILGTWLAHAMFEVPVLQWSQHLRGGLGQWIAEAVATAGLIVVVLRAPAASAAGLVASYIGAAYWFTASTSFANPAAVLGRMLSDSFAGISPASAPGYVAAQCIGALCGAATSALLGPIGPGPDDAQCKDATHLATP